MKHERIYSTISEAVKNGMPPIGFSLGQIGTIRRVRKFPEPGYYLTLSSKFKDNEKFIVKGYRTDKHDYETLDGLIQEAFSEPNHIPLRFGKRLTVKLAGKDRIAREFTTSRAATKRRWCAALVPASDKSPYGLLVVFGVDVGLKGKRNTTVLDNPVHSAIARSFALSHGSAAE